MASPLAPPPLQPPPFNPPLPPALPPVDPPLIVCPPSAPPPAAPPDFSVWAAHIPGWFWFLFVFMLFFSCAGMFLSYQVLKELRAQRRGQRLPGTETGHVLAELERRVGIGSDVIGRALGRV